MTYKPTKWENSPSTATPLNAENMNNIEKGISDLHEALEDGTLKGEKGDTGAKGAAGAKGDTGNGVKSIATSQSGSKVTLTFTMTDGTTMKSEFEIPEAEAAEKTK